MSISTSTAGYPWYTPYAPYGFQMAYETTTTFTVSAGNVPNSDFKNIIQFDSTVTVDITASGINGLDAGTIAASTKYYVFVIGSSNNPLDDNGGYKVPSSLYPAGVIISTSATPSLPFAYDMFKRIGFIYTDGSSHVVPFYQSGSGSERVMQYVNEFSELAGGTSATYAAIDVSSSVPLAGLTALLRLTVAPTAASDSVNVATYGSTPTVGNAMLAGAVAGVSVAAGPFPVITGDNGGAASLNYKVNGSAFVSVVGYIDNL